jgi:hypothetical protein
VSATLQLPGLVSDGWERRTKFDTAAAALADRHYSRRTVGSPQFAPPGRTVVLVTPDELAAWVTHWPDADKTMDGMDSWRCSLFRNEGPRLSSELILEAMRLTAEFWDERPADGWLTFVDTTKVRSKNPGACFKKAGWWHDRSWSHPRLVRLRSQAAGLVR